VLQVILEISDQLEPQEHLEDLVLKDKRVQLVLQDHLDWLALPALLVPQALPELVEPQVQPAQLVLLVLQVHRGPRVVQVERD